MQPPCIYYMRIELGKISKETFQHSAKTDGGRRWRRVYDFIIYLQLTAALIASAIFSDSSLMTIRITIQEPMHDLTSHHLPRRVSM